MKLLSFIFLLLSFQLSAQTVKKRIVFSYCQVEYQNQDCRHCEVEIQKGNELKIGSYIKVFLGKELLTEGYILKHISGNIFILEEEDDARDSTICGGCCGSALNISIEERQITGC